MTLHECHRNINYATKYISVIEIYKFVHRLLLTVTHITCLKLIFHTELIQVSIVSDN